jgi:hypothetical protein
MKPLYDVARVRGVQVRVFRICNEYTLSNLLLSYRNRLNYPLMDVINTRRRTGSVSSLFSDRIPERPSNSIDERRYNSFELPSEKHEKEI